MGYPPILWITLCIPFLVVLLNQPNSSCHTTCLNYEHRPLSPSILQTVTNNIEVFRVI
jgi:hypothetical protein